MRSFDPSEAAPSTVAVNLVNKNCRPSTMHSTFSASAYQARCESCSLGDSMAEQAGNRPQTQGAIRPWTPAHCHSADRIWIANEHTIAFPDAYPVTEGRRPD
jgi:hypothetical protein